MIQRSTVRQFTFSATIVEAWFVTGGVGKAATQQSEERIRRQSGCQYSRPMSMLLLLRCSARNGRTMERPPPERLASHRQSRNSVKLTAEVRARSRCEMCIVVPRLLAHWTGVTSCRTQRCQPELRPIEPGSAIRSVRHTVLIERD